MSGFTLYALGKPNAGTITFSPLFCWGGGGGERMGYVVNSNLLLPKHRCGIDYMHCIIASSHVSVIFQNIIKVPKSYQYTLKAWSQ